MIRIIIILFTLTYFTISCAPASKQSEESSTTETSAPQANATAVAPREGYSWSQLTDKAVYSKSYNYQLFAKDNKLYTFHPDGTFESSDGVNWVKTGLTNILKNQAFLDYVEFNGAIYALGTFSGSISDHILTTQVARTTDMKKWEILAKQSSLPKRFFYHPFVFQNKIWIISGNDGQTVYNDAWASADGINWQKIADNLPFGAQHSQHFVVFKNQIYMLSQDVWSSKDGIEWVQVSDAIAPYAINGYKPIVYDDKIWLIGNSRNGKGGSEVLYSEDGITWKTQQAPWSPRIATAACIFNDQIVITGGKYGGTDSIGADLDYLNDVWVMRKNGE